MMPGPMIDGGFAFGGGGGGHAMAGMAPGGVAPSSGSTGPALKTVDRIRNVFPETWLWSNANVGFVICSNNTL